jgi:predicted SPOUT superfamily RNA methylase MTH1
LTLEVAIPDTALIDCTDLRQKTIKIGYFGRAFAVFKVNRVVLYKTGKLPRNQTRDLELLQGLLEYMDTPQYLRRRIYPRTPMLKYAGLLPPLRTRSHPLGEETAPVSEGDVRWGIQVRSGKIDIGLKQLVNYSESMSEREPALFRISKTRPKIVIEAIERAEVGDYWGWETEQAGSLIDELRKMSEATRIAFSRNATSYGRLESEVKSTVVNTKSVLAIFGGPKRGILELVSEEKDLVKQHIDFWVNTIPDQGTETVRLEEALWISLGILNSSVGSALTGQGYHG